MQIKNILNLNKFQINNSFFKREENNGTKTIINTPISSLENTYYLPINFKANDSTIYFKDLLKFENMHCPFCGIKMLSSEEFQKIVTEGSEIEDPEKFTNWLEKNDEYISKNLKDIIKSAKKITTLNKPNNINILLDKMKEQSDSELHKAIQDMQILIKDFSEKNQINENEKVLIDECLIRLENIKLNQNEDFIKETKEIFRDTIQNLENENHHWLFYQLKNISIPVGLQNRILSHTDEDNFQRRLKIIKALFATACSNKKAFWNNMADENKFMGSTILTCPHCTKINPAEHFAAYKTHPELKNNFEQYLTDAAQNILDKEEFAKYINYPHQLAGLAKSLSKKGINIRFHTNPTLVKIKTINFHEKRKQIDFPFVNYNNVPCSTCGIATINHENKLNYFEQISNTKNIKDLLDFLSQKYKILHREYKPLIKVMQKEYNQNKNITDQNMMEKLRTFVLNDLNNQLLLNMQCCDEILPQLSDSKDIESLKNYKEGIKTNFYQKTTQNKKFDYDSYKNLLSESIYQISDQRIKSIYGTRLKESIRKKVHLQFILFPSKEISQKVGGDIKVLVQDIIKGSVATVDHVIAKDKDGDNSPENCTVMCKQCNSEKSNYNMLHWSGIHHKDIAQNMQRYLNFVTKLIKKDNIKDYENYPQIFAEKIKTITQDKIVLEYEDIQT